ncbi:MAG: type I 3-dehydroquinate dehydratase [Clostridiales bacterium]|nr:type I 3-dehydroquinate dehydratase [Clostridiales bacterium]
MKNPAITVRNLTLGDGIPKICVPVTARDRTGLEEQLVKVRAVPCDMVELRADYYDGDPIEELAVLRERMPDMPILFTFRTKEEGGERTISREAYAALNRRAAGTSDEKSPGKGRNVAAADFIDLEFNRGEELLRELCRELQESGAKVIASFHDFEKTPDPRYLVHLLCRMQELGADMTKAAVMPQNEQDVLKLLQAAVEMKTQYADRPYIVMSMGRLGGVTRLAGTLSGSAVTFATAAASSAPGQMDADLVARVLNVLE